GARVSQVNCLYCGNAISDGAEQCPHCGKASHFKKKKTTLLSVKQFYVMFAALVVLSGFLIVWFPR
ncbi:MAG: zinc ribbon domain-containing protein, partial [Motiliproteus sp.]